jgi:hypothetical protein
MSCPEKPAQRDPESLTAALEKAAAVSPAHPALRWQVVAANVRDSHRRMTAMQTQCGLKGAQKVAMRDTTPCPTCYPRR